MRSKIVRALALACLVGGATPLVAQYGSAPPPPPPARGDPPSRGRAAVAAPATYAEVLAAASCLIVRESSIGEDLLATAPFSTAERDAALAVLRAAERCLRRRTRIATSAAMARGAIAEALYEGHFREAPTARTPALAAPAFFRPAEADLRADAPTLETGFALAHCAAARDPARVRALLATEPGTAEETAALQAMTPAWNACVAPGTRLSVDRTLVRLHMAESLFRWAMVQRDGEASRYATIAPRPEP